MTLNKHRLADWSKAPEWVTHHAIDSDGVGHWYGYHHDNSSHHQALGRSKEFDLTDIDWRETLETRPEPELTDGITALVEGLQTIRRRLSNKGEFQSDPEIESLREENARLRQQLEFWASQSTLAEIPESKVKYSNKLP